MRSITIPQPKLQTALLKYEAFPDYNRSAATLLGGIGGPREIKVGTLLALVLAGAVTVGAATFAGTGNGTLTPAGTPYGSGVEEGSYKVACVQAASNGGVFAVLRPDGTIDGYAAVGAAYSGGIAFTIADGSADFVVGDAFTVPVSISGNSVVAWDPEGTDGSEVIWAIALDPAVAAAGTDLVDGAVALRRGPALIARTGIEWPDSATDELKAEALATLAHKGIHVLDT